MTVTYKTTGSDLVICHGLAYAGQAGYFVGPLGDRDIVTTEWVLQTRRYIGAASAKPHDLGNASHAYALLVTRVFASGDAARQFAQTFAGTIARGAASIVEDEPAVAAACYSGAILSRLSIERVGCSLDIRFEFATLVPTVVIPTPDTLAAGVKDSVYAGDTLAAVGGTSLTWSKLSGDLPTGLSLSSAGAITGTPTAAGTFTFGAKALDTSGAYGTQSYSITITEA
jgi:hypothetical protein